MLSHSPTHSESVSQKGESNTPQRNGFLIYAASTLFFIFLSVTAIQDFPDRWGQISLLLAGLIPLLFLIIFDRSSFIESLTKAGERYILYALLVFSILNIYTSASRWASLKAILVFFVTGISAYLITRYLLRSRENFQRFLNLLMTMFICFTIIGFLEYFLFNSSLRQIHALQSNPIPAGSVLILLLLGPWALFHHTSNPFLRSLIGVALALGFLLLVLIGERGPILAGLVLVLLAALWKWKLRGLKLGLAGVLILTLSLWLGKDLLPKHYQDKLSNPDGIHLRLDAYSLAWTLFKQHPVLGTGYNAEMEHAVPVDFKATFFTSPDRQRFIQYFERGNTFDNILLCLFVEGGSLFGLAYLAFIAFVFFKTMGARGKPSSWSSDLVILLIVLTAFGLHSMTFDSLKFPAINWLFHSLLGCLAASASHVGSENMRLQKSPEIPNEFKKI